MRTFTYAELPAEVHRCANALRGLGLGKGDAVALYMPMIPELAIAFLAIIKIGGVILPLFSGYGHGAVVTRLTDAGAKAIVTADGLPRRGAIAPMKPTVDVACADAPNVQHVIVVARTGGADTPMSPGRDYWWHDLVPAQSDVAATEITDAEDAVSYTHLDVYKRQLELGLGRTQSEPVGDLSEGRGAASGDYQCAASSAAHVCAHENHIRATCQRRIDGNQPRRLFDGESLAGQHRLVDKEILSFQHKRVRRDQACLLYTSRCV